MLSVQWSLVVFSFFVLLTAEISGLKPKEKHPSQATEPYDARLAGGGSRCSGRLEMKHQGEWRTLKIKEKEARAQVKVMYAQVACRQMDCGSVASITHSTNDSDRQPAWEVNFICQGSEMSLRECRGSTTRRGVLGRDNSVSSLDVTCSESVRLLGASAICAGSVEVKSDQGWASVCEDGFASEAEKVVCRELGCGPPSYFRRPVRVGEEPVLSKQFRCTGNESRLEDCASSTRSDCRPAPGISCTSLPVVRLVGGVNHCQGTLEGKHAKEWRPLSDVWGFWKTEHSSEVCQQLGCGGVISQSRSHLPKSRPVWELETHCDRNGPSFCKSWRESALSTVMTLECSETARLVKGRSRCSGMLEVKSGQSWAPVCATFFSSKAALVTCRDLSCGFVGDYHGRSNGDFQNVEHSPVLECVGKEKHLLDCPTSALNTTEEEPRHCGNTYLTCIERPHKPHIDIYTRQEQKPGSEVPELVRGQRFAISCSPFSDYNVLSIRLKSDVNSEHPAEQTQSSVKGAAIFIFPPAEEAHQGMYQCDYNYDFSPEVFSEPRKVYLTVKELPDVRLVGEGSHCAGRLEVEHQREWGPVSYRHSWSLKEAHVVCRQLSCGSAVSTSKVDTRAEHIPAWRFYSDCHGSERALMDCGTVKKWFSSSTVEVVCSDILLQPNISFYSGFTDGQRRDALVYRGYIFTVGCSVQPQYPGGHFSLVFTGFNQTHSRTQPAANHSARFEFAAADEAHQGNYSCVYHNFVFSHNFSSPESQSLSLTFEDYSHVMLDDGVLREDDNDICCAGKLLVDSGSVIRPLSAESAVWDLRLASVVCRQLGCGSAISTSQTALPKNTPVWRFFSDCDGSEAVLMDCGTTTLWFSSSAIEVVCTGQQGAADKS